jgi:putative two-component system response regulator
MLDHASAKSTAATKDESATPRRTLVVLAEDDADIRELVAQHLRRHDFEVEEAADGDELSVILHRLAESRRQPTVVLSDVHMPGRDGLEMLRESRALLPHVPVLMMTASGNRGTRTAASDLGAVAMLDKPLDLALLEHFITELVST